MRRRLYDIPMVPRTRRPGRIPAPFGGPRNRARAEHRSQAPSPRPAEFAENLAVAAPTSADVEAARQTYGALGWRFLGNHGGHAHFERRCSAARAGVA